MYRNFDEQDNSESCKNEDIENVSGPGDSLAETVFSREVYDGRSKR